MSVKGFMRLFDYMYWANAQMWECVQTLNEAQRKIDLDYSIGSIHSQLVHMISIENLWINYLWHGEVEFLSEEGFPNLAAIREEWDALEEEIRDYLTTLSNDDLKREISADFYSQSPMKLEDILMQVINHATDHRAQILAGIHCLGGNTVAQDYFRYLEQSIAA